MTRRVSLFCAAVLTALSVNCAGDEPATPLGGAGLGPAGGNATAGSVTAASGASADTASQAGSGGVASASGGTLVSAGSGGLAGSDRGGGDSGGAALAGTGGSAGGSGGGAATSGCAGLLLCDDFEAYDAAPGGPWKVTKQGSGSVTVDTLHAKSGTKAAHFRGTPNSDTVYMAAQGAPVFPVSGDTLFVRYLLYVDTWATPAAGQPMHERLAWIGSSNMARNADGSGYTFATYNGIAIERIASGYFRDTSQAMNADSNNVKQWVCWEFEIDNKGGPIDGGGGTARPHIWRNDSALSLKVTGSKVNWDPVPWDILQFSLFTYQPSTVPVDFWLDDVAMSKTKIGCPK
jgi:hypothetical protein